MSNRIIITLTLFCYILLFNSCGSMPTQIVDHTKSAQIYPDYDGVVLPNNISSISFKVLEDGDNYRLEVISGGEMIYSKESRNGHFAIPNGKWRKIIAANSQFEMVITVANGDMANRYAPITNYISSSDIDPYLSYRRIAPGYALWSDMGIYQRDLTSFKEFIILENKQISETGCLNCHTYGSHTTDNSMLHYRDVNGGTIISHNGEIIKVKFNGFDQLVAEGTYPVWHPSNNYIAYSVNEVGQNFHLNGNDNIVEVSDSKSDIIIYDIVSNEVIADSIFCRTDVLETFPEWSVDGKKLYFTAADYGRDSIDISSIKYNLYSVDFDPTTRELSNKQLVFDAVSHDLSLSNSKVTKCGKYLVATVADYGSFMIWHKEADLVIINLESGDWRFADEINSQFAESYHSFSSSGEWMVFSSRRGDGLFTRPYFAKFDSATGVFSKPFLMPQESVEFYDDLFYSYNIPNFSKDKFTMQRKFLNKAKETTVTKARVVVQ